jgi:hypothetical protein
MAAATYLRNSLMAGSLGPRMFYSGKALTQTGGGADFRTPIELTVTFSSLSELRALLLGLSLGGAAGPCGNEQGAKC